MKHEILRRAAAVLGVVTAFTACGAGQLPAQTRDSDHHRFTVTTVVEGLEHPWGMAFLPDGGILVTERPGRLRLVRDGRVLPGVVAGVPGIPHG
ncbi:MAG: PQQ-dependent sugar dehydrogenase [Gemmatimonadota bacterium]